MNNYTFIGLVLGNNGFKLQHIVVGEDSSTVAKVSDILFWVVFFRPNSTVYIPVSKLDMEQNTTFEESQLINSISDRTRTLIRKTDKGTSTIPLSAIIHMR